MNGWGDADGSGGMGSWLHLGASARRFASSATRVGSGSTTEPVVATSVGLWPKDVHLRLRGWALVDDRAGRRYLGWALGNGPGGPFYGLGYVMF